MSRIAESMLLDSNKDFITQIIYEFSLLAKEHNIFIPNEYMQECIDEIIVFYEKYLECFQSIFCNIDFYKIACWFCVLMATRIYNFNKQKKLEHNKNWQTLIIVYINHIFNILEKDGFVLQEQTYKVKIMKMIIMEIKQKSDFGIGKNGLYMLIKIASITRKEF